jgi:hypothetical protein
VPLVVPTAIQTAEALAVHEQVVALAVSATEAVPPDPTALTEGGDTENVQGRGAACVTA